MPRKTTKKRLNAEEQIKAAGGEKRPKFRVGSKEDRTIVCPKCAGHGGDAPWESPENDFACSF